MFGLSFVGLNGGGSRDITLSASLDATAVAGTANSATVTVNVPPGNPGIITFLNYVDVGVVTSTRYNPNGAGLTTITDGSDTSAFTNGQTILVQTNGITAGESRTVTLKDKTTGTVIATVIHTGA